MTCWFWCRGVESQSQRTRTLVLTVCGTIVLRLYEALEVTRQSACKTDVYGVLAAYRDENAQQRCEGGGIRIAADDRGGRRTTLVWRDVDPACILRVSSQDHILRLCLRRWLLVCKVYFASSQTSRLLRAREAIIGYRAQGEEQTCTNGSLVFKFKVNRKLPATGALQHMHLACTRKSIPILQLVAFYSLSPCSNSERCRRSNFR